MQLIYNAVDLATLGVLRILGVATAREPAEAPQRERVTYRVRLDFFQQTFDANFNLIGQLRAALKTQNAALVWVDDAGKQQLNRTVVAAEDDTDAAALERGGTYQQALTFTFWYYNHDVVTNCLNATVTANGIATGLGAVEQWHEVLAAARFDDLRDMRKRVAGRLTASGRLQADTTLPVAARQAALLALKDQLLTSLAQGTTATVAFGSFNEAVRVDQFTAEVNQPNNFLAWSLTASFTRYPDEANYAVLEYDLTPKLNLAEGIQYLTLSGKIAAPTEAAARARLAALQASVIPASYVTLDLKTDARSAVTESDGTADGAGQPFIELTFTVETRDPATLPAAYTATGASFGTFTLGTVDKFRDATAVTRWDELRDVRKRSAGNVVMAGKWYVADGTPAAAAQAALALQKSKLDAQVQAGASGLLTYGAIFAAAVRLTEFTAEINRLTNCIEWTLSATFTRYPNEADYSEIDFTAQTRYAAPEGITYLTLRGKIGSPSAAAAQARLTLLLAGIVPASYAQLNLETTPTTVGSETTGRTGDGLVFTEMAFTAEYRDVGTLTCTYQRTTANAAVANLGTVDKFSQRFAVTLFDELRPNRKRAAGSVSLGGKWYASEALAAAAKQTALLAQLNAFNAQMLAGDAGTLSYGAVLNQVVRLVDWDAHINKLTNCIEWSLTATYTAYPNESDYALCEFNLETRQNLADGTVFKTLTGKIGAPTPEAAQSKLARLRAALIPAGYTLMQDGTTERRVDVESGRAGGNDTGDGFTFIELAINDEWQLTAGNLLTWTLRTATNTDVKTGWTLTTYSGTVVASASTQPLAFAAAAAQAAVLGANKFPFLIRSNIISVDKLFQTPVTVGGQTVPPQVFVTVEFSYEYQAKGGLTYLEMTSELTADSFGVTTETISGYVVAPTLALAQAGYLANVRNMALFNGALILTERTPTLMQQQLYGATGALVQSLDDRFSFSLQVFRAKNANQTSIAYTSVPDSNLQTNETTTTVSGTVWAASQVVAEAFLQTVLTTLVPGGALVRSSRTPQLKRGPLVGGSATSGDVFESLGFMVVYVSALAGATGILESEVTQDLVYSGTRQIEKPIPDGLSIIQQAGITCGRNTVTARCVSTTPTAAQAWARTIRTALLLSVTAPGTAYENPPQIRTGYQFLPQIAGVPVGAGTNVKLYELTAMFSELVPELVFTP
jgi:hypothetical protein